MVGYSEALTDPSYKSQIITLTFPLIGNYGVPDDTTEENGIKKWMESHRIWAAGLVVGEHCEAPSHWNSKMTLSKWLKKEGIPGIEGIDTRQLTKRLREHGTMLGKIVIDETDPAKVPFVDPAKSNLVKEVSTQKQITFNANGFPKIMAVDCGLKYNQIRCLVSRGARVDVVPWDFDLAKAEHYDGLFLSNGPGDPQMCDITIKNLKKVLNMDSKPIFGICLGHQLIASAIGCSTYKMEYGHRGHNQPCTFLNTNR